MKKILIIPDVHGRDFWKEPVKKVGLSEEVQKLAQQYEIRLDRVAKYNSTTIENLTDEQVLESINTKKKYLEGAKND